MNLGEIYERVDEGSDLLKIVGEYPEMVREIGSRIGVLVYVLKYVESLEGGV